MEIIARLTITEKPLALTPLDADEEARFFGVFAFNPVLPPVEPSGATHDDSCVLAFE